MPLWHRHVLHLWNNDTRFKGYFVIFLCENVEVLEKLYGTDRYPEREWYVLTTDVIIMLKSPRVHSSIYLNE